MNDRTKTQPNDQPKNAAHEANGFSIERRGRFWAVMDGATLVCIAVYRKGAREVVRRLQQQV